MNNIRYILHCYYQNGLVKHTPDELIHRLKSVNPSQKQIKELSISIKYPYCNGIFVIYLDNCSKAEFIDFIFFNKKIHKIDQKIKLFYTRLSALSTNTLIDVNSFKFKSFNKPLNKSNIKPKLTSNLYIH